MTTADGTVDVLCIRPAYFHAKHYIGWTCDADPVRRIAEHLTGQCSPPGAAAVARGRSVRRRSTLSLMHRATSRDGDELVRGGYWSAHSHKSDSRFHERGGARGSTLILLESEVLL